MQPRAWRAALGRQLFLGSRIARRMFRVLLLAALVPTAGSALLVLEAVVSRDEAQAQHQARERLKQMGLRLHDRLEAARTTLAVHAAGSDWRAPPVLDPHGGVHLVGVRTLATDALAGPPPPLQWLPVPDGPAQVQLAVRDDSGRAWWVAEVSPKYLWSDFRADGAGAGLCVFGPAGERLFCPHGAPDPTASADWRLFLRASFDAADWHIVGPRMAPLAGEAGSGESLPVARLVVLALAGTLLVAMLLGLVLVRRTLVPLERLADGTRRLARGELGTRVALPHGENGDEFGELAAALNGMAARVQRQVTGLEVQARVDREILDGAPLPQTFAHVCARLAELAPGARAAILARDVASGEWLLHAGAEGIAPLRLMPDDVAWRLPPGELARHCAVASHSPAWLREAYTRTTGRPARGAAHLCSVPAVWRGEPVALLLVCAEGAPELDAGARQEVETLRDRIALALAAAAREHHLVERAVRDSLTGLLNRNGLHDACDRRIAEAAGGDGADAGTFTLLLIDLDGFKEVNDTLGHPVGDAVLTTIASRLREEAPAGATLSRIGGDEFVMLHAGPADEAEALAGRLCALVARPIGHGGHVVHLGASVGLACHPRDAADRDELLRRADVAMYAAKAAGRGSWRRYADAMDEKASERAWITRELRLALAGATPGALDVHFQPRIDLKRGQVSSTEALVRWTHPERGAVSPGRFVPVAEDAGLIERLGDFVLDTALAQRRRWRDQGLACGRIAVNVSARQLRDAEFATRILAALERHGLPPSELELEITESLFAGDAAAVQRALQPLRERGVWVALDDFGTGYSSLAALQSLPIDVLKIDRSFVIELGTRESAHAVVRSVIALARALGKRVVAEGVETAEQERHLVALGCDEFQGFLYARPMPGGPFAARVAAGFGGSAAPAAPAPTRPADLAPA
ncbi:MAG: EAL domain-containing protein [Rubrivivax sp.]|nr:EAL domain-containing protein [Rubrivivax sp.]